MVSLMFSLLVAVVVAVVSFRSVLSAYSFNFLCALCPVIQEKPAVAGSRRTA